MIASVLLGALGVIGALAPAALPTSETRPAASASPDECRTATRQQLVFAGAEYRLAGAARSPVRLRGHVGLALLRCAGSTTSGPPPLLADVPAVRLRGIAPSVAVAVVSEPAKTVFVRADVCARTGPGRLVPCLRRASRSAPALPPVSASDLAVRLSAGGSTSEWLVALATVENRGAADARDVVVSFALPDGAAVVRDGPEWGSAPECWASTTCVVPRIGASRSASVAIVYRPGGARLASVRVDIRSRTRDSESSNNASSATPTVAPPPVLGPPPVFVPGPGAPQAVLTTAAGAFALVSLEPSIVVPIGVPSLWAPTGPPQATVAPGTADPQLPRLAEPLVLAPGELIRFHLPFVPRTVALDGGMLRPDWLEPTWFGTIPFAWRAPARAGLRRTAFWATDQVGNRLTYPFDYVVRARP